MAEIRERTVLVAVERTARRRDGEREQSDPHEALEELTVLAESAGAEVVDRILQSRPAFDPATLVGSGKLDELKRAVNALRAETVIFDHELAGVQHRNLEKALDVKVLDRTQLILDIFARRARTREGQLQVELAQLTYLLPRLTGRGAAMSRLGGGIGTRGPGETQLESDRRRIRQRIKRIERDLEAVRGARGVQRHLRQAVPLATISLVGYTNAGKSTLFNRLTGAGVLADQRMFATLDPTVRQLTLPSRRRVLLSDTVGFIRQLPTTLVRAFRATLEEVTEAALLLHVVDGASSAAAEHCAHVREVLAEIGAEATPQILVLNKIDLMEGSSTELPSLLKRIAGSMGWAPAMAVSARSGAGLDELMRAIDRFLPDDPIETARFRFPRTELANIHLLYEFAKVIEAKYGETGCEVVAAAPASVLRKLSRWRAPL